MTAPSDPAAAAALAAAVAAAAEIARNSPLCYNEVPAPQPSSPQQTTQAAAVVPDSVDKNEKAVSPQRGQGEEDAEKRLARSRERNREHARRTRLRKKAQLEALQAKVLLLEDERRVLKQSIEECSIASILVGLSTGNQNIATESLFDETEVKSSVPEVTRVGKRKRFVCEESSEVVPQPLKLIIGGEITLIGGGKSHINWKTGVYCDESGIRRQLTADQLESLRRERNRMHAKMTRDRKKSFISSVEKRIQYLEGENKRMRDVLAKVAEMVGSESVTPVVTSPLHGPSATPDIQDEGFDDTDLASKLNQHLCNSFKLTTT